MDNQTCQTCGSPISWAKKPDGQWSRPLQVIDLSITGIENALVVINGVVHKAAAPTFYVMHVCGLRPAATDSAWVDPQPVFEPTPQPLRQPPRQRPLSCTNVRPHGPHEHGGAVFPHYPYMQPFKCPGATDEATYAISCPICGAAQFQPCRTGNVDRVDAHVDRYNAAHNDKPVGHWKNGPWPPSQVTNPTPYRQMQRWLTENPDLLTSLSTASAADLPAGRSSTTYDPTTPGSGSVADAGSPVSQPSEELLSGEGTSSGQSRRSASEGSNVVPTFLQPSDAKPDRARDAGNARKARQARNPGSRKRANGSSRRRR